MNNNNKHEKQSHHNQNNPQKSANPSQGQAKEQCSSMDKNCHRDQKADKSEKSSEHKRA